MLLSVWPKLQLNQKIYLSGQSTIVGSPPANIQANYSVDQIIVKSSLINPSQTVPLTLLVTSADMGLLFDPSNYNMTNGICSHQAAPIGAGDPVIPQNFVTILKFEHDQFIQPSQQPFNIYGGGQIVPPAGNIFISYAISIFYRLHN